MVGACVQRVVIDAVLWMLLFLAVLYGFVCWPPNVTIKLLSDYIFSIVCHLTVCVALDRPIQCQLQGCTWRICGSLWQVMKFSASKVTYQWCARSRCRLTAEWALRLMQGAYPYILHAILHFLNVLFMTVNFLCSESSHFNCVFIIVVLGHLEFVVGKYHTIIR